MENLEHNYQPDVKESVRSSQTRHDLQKESFLSTCPCVRTPGRGTLWPGHLVSMNRIATRSLCVPSASAPRSCGRKTECPPVPGEQAWPRRAALWDHTQRGWASLHHGAGFPRKGCSFSRWSGPRSRSSGASVSGKHKVVAGGGLSRPLEVA